MDEAAGAALGRALSAGEREFRELADFAPVLIWRSGPDKLCDWFNKPWLDFVGRSMDEGVGYGWAEGVHPDDFDRCVAIYTQAFDARRAFQMEYRLRRYDGVYRWVLDNGAPYSRDGEFAGYFGSCVDVTAHHEAASKQKLLIDELNHRVQNTLTIVQAIARKSFVDGRPAEETREVFYDRLQALSAAHTVLTRENWDGASLLEVVRGALVEGFGEDQIELSGDDAVLPPSAAASFALAIHELCTNALKYGALSNGTGRVSVQWTVSSGPERRLHLSWRESGGPPVVRPARQGFGSSMLERGLARELKGSVRLDFDPAGLVCTIDAALPEGSSEILDLSRGG